MARERIDREAIEQELLGYTEKPVRKRKKWEPPAIEDISKVAYGYGRVSHQDQVERDNSLPAQEAACLNYFRHALEPQGFTWGGMFLERGVSAFKKPFLTRPQARKLMATCKHGDQMIVTRLDRLWRSVRDFVLLGPYLEKRGINLHVIDMRIDSTTAVGNMMIQLMVCLAEMESRLQSERRKAIHNHRLSSKIAETQVHGKGYWYYYDEQGKKRQRIKSEDREYAVAALELIAAGNSVERTMDALNAAYASAHGLPYNRNDKFHRKNWRWKVDIELRRSMARELRWRVAEHFGIDPTMITHDISPLRAYGIPAIQHHNTTMMAFYWNNFGELIKLAERTVKPPPGSVRSKQVIVNYDDGEVQPPADPKDMLMARRINPVVLANAVEHFRPAKNGKPKVLPASMLGVIQHAPVEPSSPAAQDTATSSEPRPESPAPSDSPQT